MAIRWRRSLVVLGLAFMFVLSACGGEGTVENQDNQCDPDQEDCPPEENQCDPWQEGCPLPCDQDDFDSAEEYEACLCDEGFQEFCAPEPAGCQNDDDCGDRFCEETTNPVTGESDRICVSQNYICTSLNCSGEPGVCDPDARACVNAEYCTSTNDCLGDYLCIENSCELEAEVCDCPVDHDCVYDRDNLVVSCENPAQVCEPGSRICEGNILQACNSEGTARRPIECVEGCEQGDDSSSTSTTGYCLLPQGDACHTPFVASHGFEFEIDWDYFSNIYDPGPSTGCVTANTNLLTTSTDVSFEVTVPAGEVLTVKLTMPTNHGVLYLMDSCDDFLESCKAASGHVLTSAGNSQVRTLWYHNDTSADETLFVVADSGPSGVGQKADISFDISPRICTPEARSCGGTTVQECNATGTGHFDVLECVLGCDDADGRCETHAHSSCAAPYNLRDNGYSYTGRITEFREEGSTFNAGTACASTTGSGFNYSGATAYFEIDLIAGERVMANLASQFNAALWLATDCIADGGSCLATVNAGAQTEQLVYQAADDETVILVVQAVQLNKDHTGEFTIDISVDHPVCADEAADTVLGCTDDNRLRYCTTSDFASYYACAGDCIDGECVPPSGDRCFDPIPVSGGQTLQGSFADQSYTLPNPTGCLGSGVVARASDTIYQIELAPNEILNAELTTASNTAGLYLLSDCPLSGSTASLCEAGNFSSKKLDIYKPDGGTYYLVVASTSASDSASFSLSIDISSGICLPGELLCADGATTKCNDTADHRDVVEYCAASCGTTACAGASGSNNSCSQALQINNTRSSVVRDVFGSYFQNRNLQSGTCGLPHSLSGNDAFYRVTLAPMQGVSATLTTSVEAALVVYESCADDACIESKVVSSSDKTLDFYSGDGGTYIIAAKKRTFDENSTAAFEVKFDFFSGECSPSDNFCVVEGDVDIARQCTALGQRMEVECPYGCVSGECLDKPGDFCSSAFDLDVLGTEADGFVTFTETYNLAGFTNSYSPADPSTGLSCTGWYGDGPEVVFSFTGWNGDVLNVDMTTDYDGTLWLTTDCGGGGAAQCLAGVANTFGAGTETLTFPIEETRTYFLMADAVQAGASGSMTIDVSIEMGPRLLEPEIVLSGTFPITRTLFVEETSQRSFTITNAGELDLEFDIEGDDGDWISVSPLDGTVAGGGSSTINVDLTCPEEPGTFTTTLVINSNDRDNGVKMIPVELNCALPPGSITVTFVGVPDGASVPALRAQSDLAGYWLNTQNNFSRSDLVPGEYTITASQPIFSGDDEYNFAPVTVVIPSADHVDVEITWEAQ